jgi:hypothetical protein
MQCGVWHAKTKPAMYAVKRGLVSQQMKVEIFSKRNLIIYKKWLTEDTKSIQFSKVQKQIVLIAGSQDKWLSFALLKKLFCHSYQKKG